MDTSITALGIVLGTKSNRKVFDYLRVARTCQNWVQGAEKTVQFKGEEFFLLGFYRVPRSQLNGYIYKVILGEIWIKMFNSFKSIYMWFRNT